jgi:anaerobic ribonucleoside-triphosphate reductase activating protein
MLNGDGLRVSFWVAGCNHHCKNCQNPQTWDNQGGIPFVQESKQELFQALSPDYISGITFTGGDPLAPFNRQEITELSNEIKRRFPDKTQWLYTGYSFDEIKDLDIIKNLDVIVDGEYIEDLKDYKLHWCGSSNQNVIYLNK